MKNRNPYLSHIISWIIVIFINLIACILGVLNGILWQAFFNLAIAMIDCICLGWTICKFNDYREFVNYMREMEEKMKSIGGLCAEEEPFKEFENNGESSSRKV